MADVFNVHQEKKNCIKTFVKKESCYISFSETNEEVQKALIVPNETTRGETLVLDLNKDGKIIGVDIFAPGMKNCQPNWEHTREEEKENA